MLQVLRINTQSFIAEVLVDERSRVVASPSEISEVLFLDTQSLYLLAIIAGWAITPQSTVTNIDHPLTYVRFSTYSKHHPNHRPISLRLRRELEELRLAIAGHQPVTD